MFKLLDKMITKSIVNNRLHSYVKMQF